MILDERTELCDATACNTGAAATYNVGDLIDTSVVRDIGNGEPVYLVVTVATGITVASSTGTVSFQLVSDSTDTVATDGTQTIHVRSESWDTSTVAIAAGTVLACLALPPEGSVYERYLGLQQVTGTTALNAGAINAAFTLTPYTAPKAYPNAI